MYKSRNQKAHSCISALVMKLAIFLLAIFIICGARDIIFDSFDYTPKGSNDLIDFGTLKLRKSKAKNTFNLRGNFTLKRSLGNEKIVIFEVYKRAGGMLVTTRYPFCDFTTIDKSFWPELLKVSNMTNDCPLEEVRLTVAATHTSVNNAAFSNLG